MKKFVALLLSVCLCLSGCKKTDAEREAALNAAREYSNRFDSFKSAEFALQNIAPMFVMVTDAQYQSLKNSVKLSSELRKVYFPTETYNKNELLAMHKSATITNICLSDVSGATFVYTFTLNVTNLDMGGTRYYLYKATYNSSLDEITMLDLLFEYI